MGEVSNFALLPVAIASMELLGGWGLDAVAAYARTLTTAIASGAADLGFDVAAPPARSPHLLGLRLPTGLDTAAVATQLRDHQVHVSVRGTSLRVSTHVFNTADDVERLLQVLGVLAKQRLP
jgi:selenocysteine lyase/cysteine desulfurase